MASHGFLCLFSSERSYFSVFTFIPHPNLETSSRLPSFSNTISQCPQRPPRHPEVCSLNSPPILSPHDLTRLNLQPNVSWNIPQWSEIISCSYLFCKQAFIPRWKFKKLFHCLWFFFLSTNEIKTCLSHTYVVWGGSDAPSPAGLELLSCPDEVQDLLSRVLQLVGQLTRSRGQPSHQPQMGRGGWGEDISPLFTPSYSRLGAWLLISHAAWAGERCPSLPLAPHCLQHSEEQALTFTWAP